MVRPPRVFSIYKRHIIVKFAINAIKEWTIIVNGLVIVLDKEITNILYCFYFTQVSHYLWFQCLFNIKTILDSIYQIYKGNKYTKIHIINDINK